MSIDVQDTVKTDKISLAEHRSDENSVIAVATLNKPKALNALDLDMAKDLLAALRHWETRDDIMCVVLMAEGDKAFCAGGDIVSMYQAMEASPKATPEFVEEFFTCEYTLDYTIHTYKKPIIVWGTGIVMGGGMGLLTGASHRLVTQSSRLAMPEVTIGLYPDVGGSYFLPRLPGHTGMFLGLTGASMNATDACYLGLADQVVDEGARKQLIASLIGHTWHTRSSKKDQVDYVLSSIPAPESPPKGNVEAHRALIDRVCDGDSLGQVVRQIVELDDFGNKWLAKAKATLKSGSPITAHLVYQQCVRGKGMSLLGCFEMELIMSYRCGEFGELQEGIRALLIDKDNAPNWTYPDVESVPPEVIVKFFTSPYRDHPLSELEKRK